MEHGNRWLTPGFVSTMLGYVLMGVGAWNLMSARVSEIDARVTALESQTLREASQMNARLERMDNKLDRLVERNSP